MDPSLVKALLEGAIANSEVQVDIDGSHCNLVVISPEFEGLSPVKKQQLVLWCVE